MGIEQVSCSNRSRRAGKRLLCEFGSCTYSCVQVKLSRLTMASSSDQPRSELQTTTSSTSLGSVEVTVESISSGCNRPTKECNAVVCCVRVPNRLLQAWYHTKVCGDTDTSEDTSYIQLLNDHVRGKTLTFDVNCERLESNLYRRASEVAKRATRTKPN